MFVYVGWDHEEAGRGREGEVFGAVGSVRIGNSASACGASHHRCGDGVVSLGEGSGERRRSHMQVTSLPFFTLHTTQ